MRLSSPTLLETLFWEIKNRVFYIVFSFFFTFIIAYQNSRSLLYIFVLSYRSTHKKTDFNIEKQVIAKSLEPQRDDPSFSFLRGKDFPGVVIQNPEKANSEAKITIYEPLVEHLDSSLGEALTFWQYKDKQLLKCIESSNKTSCDSHWLQSFFDTVLQCSISSENLLINQDFQGLHNESISSIREASEVFPYLYGISFFNFKPFDFSVAKIFLPLKAYCKEILMDSPEATKIGDFKEAILEGKQYLFRATQFFPQNFSLSESKTGYWFTKFFEKNIELNREVNLVELTESLSLYDSIFESDVNYASISFIFTDVEEAFSNIILICFIFSLISVVPIVVYHIFSFLSPSLYFHESLNWFFRLFIIIWIWCFFIYNLQNFIIPKLAQFLLLFEISSSAFSLSAETKISSYCSWVSKIWIITNGFFFLFVTIFLFFHKTHIPKFGLPNEVEFQYIEVKKNNWFGVRKVNAIISILVSALLTPPEAIQFILALLFFIVFEIFIYFFTVIKYFSHKKNLLLK